MIFKIDWIETKKEDWKVATLHEAIENGQSVADVSINRNDKDGSVAFPNFNDLTPGSEIQGNLWKHPTTGRYTLYPLRQPPKNDGEVVARQGAPQPSYVPRSGPAGMMATKAANIESAQERKNEAIEKAQENKSNAIKVAAAMRDATLISIALMNNDPEGAGEFTTSFTRIKEWYLAEWEKTEKSLDVPF